MATSVTEEAELKAVVFLTNFVRGIFLTPCHILPDIVRFVQREPKSQMWII
jgi:hypothetical protein